MPAFKVPRLPRRRTLAAAIAAGVVGSFLVTAAPASAEVTSCTSHMNSWAKIFGDYDSWFFGGGAEACIGFVSNNAMDISGQVFCAGNNQGIVTYYDVNTGRYDRHTFWPGGVYEVINGTYTQALTTTPDFIEVVNVQITGYSGSAICLLAIPASAAPGAVSGSRECPSCPSDTEQRAPRRIG